MTEKTHPPIVQAAFILLYLYPVVIIAGTLGNLISFITFSRKKFRNTIFFTYFRFLTIVDTIVLIFMTTNKFIRMRWEISLRDENRFWCIVSLSTAYFVPSISNYILVAISLDRWISIVKSSFFTIRKKLSFQMVVCIAIFFYNVVFNGQLFFSYIQTDSYFERETNTTISVNKCLIVDLNVLKWMDLANSTIIPFSLMTISSTFTIKSIFASRRKVLRIPTQFRVDEIATQIQSSSLNESSVETRKRDRKFAITSITLNLIFLVLNLPFCVYDLFYDYFSIDADTSYLIDSLLLMMCYMNYGSVFFINWSVNSIFTKELKTMFNLKNQQQS